MQHKENIRVGVVFGVFTALFAALISFFIKMIGERASPDMILFCRLFVSMVLILPWVIAKRQEVFRVSQVGSLVGRSLSTILAAGALIYTLKYLSLTQSIVLSNTYPLFVPIIFQITHKLKTNGKVWGSIVLGFLGVVLYLHPSFQMFNLGLLFGMICAVFSAISIVMIRLMTKSISVLQIIFFYFLIGSVITGILLPFNWISFGWDTALLLFCVGLSGVSYQLASTLCLAKAPARIGAPLIYFSILFGGILDYFMWGKVPNGLSLFGALLVILGGVATIYFGQKEFKPNPKTDVKL
ncbi:MAG: DMT family transporter [Verrucomicrobia bacterium]|nr:DMT family transporter [Verrucomicrobiota bacterium]